jgi:hypothetical protein
MTVAPINHPEGPYRLKADQATGGSTGDSSATGKADYDEPTKVLHKTWALVSVEELTFGPEPVADDDE